MLDHLVKLARDLGGCTGQHYDERLSPNLSKMPPGELKSLTNAAAEVTRNASWFGRFNPMRLLRGRKVYGFPASSWR
jgi:hypothetical protein